MIFGMLECKRKNPVLGSGLQERSYVTLLSKLICSCMGCTGVTFIGKSTLSRSLLALRDPKVCMCATQYFCVPGAMLHAYNPRTQRLCQDQEDLKFKASFCILEAMSK